MNAPSLLSEIEENISKLSVDDQLWLIERVTQRIRENIVEKNNRNDRLRDMAADPEIQKELQAIEREFASAEEDGLGTM